MELLIKRLNEDETFDNFLRLILQSETSCPSEDNLSASCVGGTCSGAGDCGSCQEG